MNAMNTVRNTSATTTSRSGQPKMQPKVQAKMQLNKLRCGRPPARGFAMLAAIFILVVVAALGSYIAVISSNQQMGTALDVQGTRAYSAARSGLEWGLYQVNVVNAHATCASASGSFVPAAPSLSGFTVTVTCSATADANGGPTVFSLSAIACNQPNAGSCPNTSSAGTTYVERRIDVTF